MRGRDLIGMALAAFRQAKVRAALTLAGIVLGTAMLAVSLSLGHGLRRYVADEFRKDDRLRTIYVYVSNGSPRDESAIPPAEIAVPDTVGPARRERLRKRLIQKWREQQPSQPASLTQARLAEIGRIAHVASVRPEIFERVEVAAGDLTAGGMRLEALAPGNDALSGRLVAGRLPAPDRREVLISEWTLYQWGVQADADVERFIGRTLTVTARNDDRAKPYLMMNLLGAVGAPPSPEELQALGDLAERLPEALDRLGLPADRLAHIRALLDRVGADRPATPKSVAAEFTVVGVYYQADARDDDDYWAYLSSIGEGDLVAPLGPVHDLLAGLPRFTENGYHRAVVIADDESHVREVVQALKDNGLRTGSLVEWAERATQEVTLIGAGMTVLSVLTLVVAGLGITNTMVTSVLERTREIGVMKAVGARDRQVLGLFLVEGAAVGLVGGLLGLLAAWLASFPGEAWIRGVLEHQSQQKVTGTIFRFPPWLVTAAPAFAAAVTTAAAFLPARRAARIDPAVTLRTE